MTENNPELTSKDVPTEKEVEERGIDIDVIGKIKPILNLGLDALKVNKDKAAASIIALPTCFEYGVMGHKAYAKPSVRAIKEYFKHLREVWLG